MKLLQNIGNGYGLVLSNKDTIANVNGLRLVVSGELVNYNRGGFGFSFFVFFDLFSISMFYLQPASCQPFIYNNLHLDTVYVLLGIFLSVAVIYIVALVLSYREKHTIKGLAEVTFKKFREDVSSADHCPLTETLWSIIPLYAIYKLLVSAISLVFGAVSTPIAVAFSVDPLETVTSIIEAIREYMLSFNFIKALEKPVNSDVSEVMINVTASQWSWSYNYVSYSDVHNHNVNFDASLDDSIQQSLIDLAAMGREDENSLLNTTTKVVVPLHSKITVNATSTDVVHSWSIPAIGLKVDCVPGRMHQLDMVYDSRGMYIGQCSEFCGVGHGFMPIEIAACDPDDYFCFLAHKASEDGLENYKLKWKGEVINPGPVDSSFWRFFFEGMYLNKFWAEDDNYLVDAFSPSSLIEKVTKLVKTFPTIKYVTYQPHCYPYFSKKMVSYNIDKLFPSYDEDDYYSITCWHPKRFKNSYYRNEFIRKSISFNQNKLMQVHPWDVERAFHYLKIQDFSKIEEANLFRALTYGTVNVCKKFFYKDLTDKLEHSERAIDKWALNGRPMGYDTVYGVDFSDVIGGRVISMDDKTDFKDYFNYVTLTLTFKNRITQLHTNVNFPTLNLFDVTYKYKSAGYSDIVISMIVYFSGLKDIFKHDLSSYWGYLNYRFNGSMPDYRDLTFLTRYIQFYYGKRGDMFCEMLYSQMDVNFFKFIFDSIDSSVYKNSGINFRFGYRDYFSKIHNMKYLEKSKVMSFGKVYELYTAKLFYEGKINLRDVDSFRFSKSTTPEMLNKMKFNKDGKSLKYVDKINRCSRCADKSLLKFIWSPRMYLKSSYKVKSMLLNKFAYKSRSDVINAWLKSK